MIRFYLIQFMILAIMISALSSCGVSKSGQQNTNSFNLLAAKPLVRCQKVKDTNFSINSAVVLDAQGQLAPEYLKMKFNFLSSTVTTSGNSVRFFKWRVVGSQSQLDNAPLPFAPYDLSTGQVTGTAVTAMNTASITPSTAVYIQMNDPNSQFQVIKMVVYDSAGAIVAQMNSLIPEYLANPTDYQLNSDGTARALNLQQLHPLYGQDVSAWTALQFSQHFDVNCF